MSELATLRKKIDHIDEEIIKLLAERQKICRAIGQLKIEQDLPVVDIAREQTLAEFYRHLSTTHALSPEFVIDLFEKIILESRKVQEA